MRGAVEARHAIALEVPRRVLRVRALLSLRRWQRLANPASNPSEDQMLSALGSLHTGRLVLTTVDPLQAADQAMTKALLGEIGLAGARRNADTGFAAGAALGSLVAFTGCAVQFDGPETAMADSGPWIEIPPATATPRLLWGRNTRPPRCQDCGTALRIWRERLAAPDELADLPGRSCDAGLSLRCDTCGTEAAVHRWRWGRHAGAGRSFVLIEEVFPGEARPLPPLMQALTELGAGPWSFFYVQD
jgi:hypothetical protein